MIPTEEQNPDGLHRRYNVTKADGSPTDPGAVYFVLRLDWGGSDTDHVIACRMAALEYARNAPENMQQVAKELEQMIRDTPRTDF